MKAPGSSCMETNVSLGALRAQSEGAWKRAARGFGCSLVAFLLSLPSARADVVADWTSIALQTVISSEQRPARAAHEMAMVHVAMFETMNFIEGVYVPRFLVRPPQALNTSSAAAAAAAAHHVLVKLHPEQKAALDAALNYSVAEISDGAKKASGMTTGKALGANIYAVLHRGPIPAGGDARVAGTSSAPRVSTREAGASAAAWYWIVAQLVEAQHLKVIQSARLYAIVSMALSDAYGAHREAKHYSYEPGYPCAPCTAGAAIQVVLESEFGPAAGIPGMALSGASVTRATYAPLRIREYARELASEHISASVGRQVSIGAEEEIGRKIGLQVLTYYKPISMIGLQ